MATGKQAIKRRIRSVEATKKITQAMELIATSKLQKQKLLLEQNREYSETLNGMLSSIVANATVDDVFWFDKREDTNPATIILTSDLGLCGGFNTNLLKLFAFEKLTSSKIAVIGTKGLQWLKNRNVDASFPFVYSEDITYGRVGEVLQTLLDHYRNNEITSIRIIYTQFVNSVTFEPRVKQLLPFVIQKDEHKEKKLNKDTIFEPNAQEILNDLVPMALRSMIYRYFLESKTSEQASRRLAMENATDNAQEIIEDLTLKYNQSRQAAITQEISEIIAGADAL